MARDRQAGMTLMEVLVSASVLLVILMGVSSLLLAVRRSQTAVAESEAALFHAEGIAERIGATAFSEIPVDFRADGQDVTAASGVVRTLPNERVTVAYPDWDWAAWEADPDPDLIPDPLTIRISVAWQDSDTGAPRTERLTIVRSASVP